jgi:hypothetical protein
MTALPVAVTAIPVGIAFGFILERAGLGDPRKILGQLVLRDFTVVRVMFGAIVTAMLLLVVSAALGIVDMTTIAVPPTDIGAQVLGGVIFGGGFAVAALCPGTACVAAERSSRRCSGPHSERPPRARRARAHCCRRILACLSGRWCSRSPRSAWPPSWSRGAWSIMSARCPGGTFVALRSAR